MLEKKSYTIICQGKNSRGLGKQVLTQTKSPIPPSEVKLSIPELGLCHSHFFQQFLELVGPNNSTSI